LPSNIRDERKDGCWQHFQSYYKNTMAEFLLLVKKKKAERRQQGKKKKKEKNKPNWNNQQV